MGSASVLPGTLCAWKGASLLLTHADGSAGDSLTGYYYREARFLDRIRLEIDGAPPWLCEAAAPAPDTLTFNYVHPEITSFGGGGTGQSDDEERLNARGIPERALDVSLEYRAIANGLDVALTIANRSRRDVRVELAWIFHADFADIQEAQSATREQEAPVDARKSAHGLELAYEHAQLPYLTHILYTDTWEVRGSSLAATVALPPRGRVERRLRIRPLTGAGDLSDDDVSARERVLAEWRDAFVRVRMAGNRLAEQVLSDNVRDIASLPLLDGTPDEWLAMQAGMPAYPAFFGRDAVTSGWQAAILDRGRSLEAALARLARMQSDTFDEWRDAEPGRIPYQMRVGPLALLNINPFGAYYADFASPLMYVISLANLYAWTGDRGRLARYWDAARRILDWARDQGDRDRDGYLEYETKSSKGTKNQGWKDSGDAIVYEDGSAVPAPIATCEIQGYWFAAQQLMAALATAMNAPDDARGHARNAEALKARFNQDWWVEADRCFALAMDPDKRRVRAATSNVGHCLACGIIDAERVPAVVGRLFEPDMFSGWGIRTLSSTHAYYNPISYHRGTVWSVEQATIAFGLRRYGFDARALDLVRAQFDLARLYPDHRIPECVGGYARGERATPGAYPRSNPVQLWNASAFLLLVQTVLGIVPLAPAGVLMIDPVLPDWLPDLEVRDLRVGEAQVSLRFRLVDGRTKWEVLHTRGRLRVVRQPPPESLTAGVADRLRGALESLV
jgi:glycogen debranching enzyme